MANELQWKPLQHGDGEFADIDDGIGRYIIAGPSDQRLSLRLNGELIGMFDTVAEAKARAQAGADNARAMEEDYR